MLDLPTAVGYNTVMDITTVTIGGRDYTLDLAYREIMNSDGTVWARSYHITGARGADGAITVHLSADYRGRAVAVGIAALERLNWWDVTAAIATHVDVCAEWMATR